MVYCIWHRYNRRVCQPVPVIWKKKKNPTPIRAVLGASHLGFHTCNMAESLYGQHFCLTPAITQFAAVSRGWQRCLHPITVCGWIQGKSLYLPGFTDGVILNILWLLEWRINISFKTLLCSCLISLSASLSLFLMQAEKRKPGKDFYHYPQWTWNQHSVLSVFPVTCLFVWPWMWSTLRPLWILTISL